MNTSLIRNSSIWQRVTSSRIPFAIAAAAVLLLVACNQAPPPLAEGGSGNASVPDYGFQTLNGNTRHLSEFRGKVVVVDFWATWCPPCREEIPHLVRLQADNKNKELVVIGLSVENPNRDAQRVTDFAKEMGINYLVGYAPPQMANAYLVGQDQPIPQTLIFGRNGKKVEHLIGFNPIREGLQLRRVVDEQLALSSVTGPAAPPSAPGQ